MKQKQKLVWASAMGLCLLSGSSLSYAVEDPNEFAHIAMVGIVSDQTLRLNVRAIKRTDVSPGPCLVALGFTLANGRAVGAPVIRVLQPGQASYLDVPGGAVGTGTTDLTGRIELHPVVRVQANANPLAAPCAGVAATAEVFDVTGRTSVFIEDPDQFGVEDPDI